MKRSLRVQAFEGHWVFPLGKVYSSTGELFRITEAKRKFFSCLGFQALARSGALVSLVFTNNELVACRGVFALREPEETPDVYRVCGLGRERVRGSCRV